MRGLQHGDRASGITSREPLQAISVTGAPEQLTQIGVFSRSLEDEFEVEAEASTKSYRHRDIYQMRWESNLRIPEQQLLSTTTHTLKFTLMLTKVSFGLKSTTISHWPPTCTYRDWGRALLFRALRDKGPSLRLVGLGCSGGSILEARFPRHALLNPSKSTASEGVRLTLANPKIRRARSKWREGARHSFVGTTKAGRKR